MPQLHAKLHERIGNYVELWVVLPFDNRSAFCGTAYPIEMLDENNIAEVVAITVINRTLAFLNDRDQPTTFPLPGEFFEP